MPIAVCLCISGIHAVAREENVGYLPGSLVNMTFYEEGV